MDSAPVGANAARATRARWLALLAPLALLSMPAPASAHLERHSYWPDPAADRSLRPAAGGEAPNARSLASALERSARGDTHVVCKPDSLRRALRSIRGAQAHGFEIRPSQPKLRLSAKRAQRLSELNRAFFRRCGHRHIQKAVDAAGNNDRVVIMPGRYYEQPSRRQTEDDPRCDRFENADGSLSYRYHVNCTNDANLIAVIGRRPGGEAPDPPLSDRHGIPDDGPCIRCNLQIEGSGPKPHDVLIDLAKHPRKTRLRETPEEYAKDVGLKLERADGAVVRNLTIAHAEEHGIYVIETDGYLVDRMRLLWNRIYGTLVFTSDHGVIEDSDAAGSGDASVYPGAAPDTGEQTVEAAPRTNTVIRRNDLHHSAIGCSCAAMGNAMLIKNNHAYDNGTGISTDSTGAGGHPGFPQDSSRYVSNDVYSNNFAIYSPDSDVPPSFFTVVGVGMAIWGGNSNLIEGNRIWDNWRYGAMLFTVPDVAADADPSNLNSTSFNNRYTRNVMGIAPGGETMPNGVDFWWDAFPGTTGNRWCNNVGIGGRPTSDPPAPLLPGCQGPSIGLGDPGNEAEFAVCGAFFLAGDMGNQSCEWWRPATPPSGSRAVVSQSTETSPGEERAGELGGVRGFACDVLGLATFASCAGKRGDDPSGGAGPAALRPIDLRKAECNDWNAASVEERMAALSSLTARFGENLPQGSPAQTLPNDEAYELFERICSRAEAKNFLLWGVYIQAAAFSGYEDAYEAARRRLDETPR